MSLRSNLVSGLTALGWRAAKETNLRVTYVHPRYETTRMFLGNKGSLRLGRTIGESIPVSPGQKQRIAERGRKHEEDMQQLHETDR